MKYIAHCPMQNWEGLRRDSLEEAEKDLFEQINLSPQDSFIGSTIKVENSNSSLFSSGSTFVECNLLECKFTQDKDTLEITSDFGNVRMKGITDGGLILSSVFLQNLSGGRDYSFPGNKVTELSGYNRNIEKGRYLIIPKTSNYTPGAYKSLRMFVWWRNI